jgi:hypothetical protein
VAFIAPRVTDKGKGGVREVRGWVELIGEVGANSASWAANFDGATPAALSNADGEKWDCDELGGP